MTGARAQVRDRFRITAILSVVVVAGVATWFAQAPRHSPPTRLDDAAVPRAVRPDFVGRRGTTFELNGARFRVAGVNNHYLTYGSRAEVLAVLDDAVAMNANVVRVFVSPIIGSEDGTVPTIFDRTAGADSSNLRVGDVHMASWDPVSGAMKINDGPNGLQRLDFLLAEAAKRDLRLIVAFLDYWGYTGGARQISAWYGGGVDDHFFAEDPRTKADYKRLVRAIVERVNVVTGKAYRDDPTIFAWELMNEPDIRPTALFMAWVGEMAAYVKSLDPDHMLASGHDGVRTRLIELNIPELDFGTWHGYPAYRNTPARTFGETISEYCRRAEAFDKPVILEEFGLARSDPARPKIYADWLATIADDPRCAGWLVWRLVSRQDGGDYPNDDHDQFDIHADGSPVWSVLKDAAQALRGSTARRAGPPAQPMEKTR